MTVTYRRAKRSSKPLSGECPDCGTRCDVEVDTDEAIIIRIDGRTCPACNPGSSAASETSSRGPGRPRTVTILQEKPNGSPPRVRTVVTEPAGRTERTTAERVCTPSVTPLDDATLRTADEWRVTAEPFLTGRMGAGNWQIVGEAWQPVHCSSLDAMAGALDEAWTSEVPSADRTVLTLAVGSLAIVPATLLAETVTRWLSIGRGQSIAELGGHVRTLAAICCAGRGFAAWCAPLPRALGDGAFGWPVEDRIREAADQLPVLTGANLAERVLPARPAVPEPAQPFRPAGDALAAASGLLAEGQRTPPVPATFGR